jgi:outer membrane receptor protein involved in Fe transport
VRQWQQANPVLADSLLDAQQVMAWFQDDWRAAQRLTLNLGIRWDADFNFYDQQHFENNATLLALKAIGDPHAALPKTPLKDFSPRVGFAFDLRGTAGVCCAVATASTTTSSTSTAGTSRTSSRRTGGR